MFLRCFFFIFHKGCFRIYWRHKILNVLGTLGFNQLQGIIVSDEAFFRESLKYHREIAHRKDKKRGEKDKKTT